MTDPNATSPSPLPATADEPIATPVQVGPDGPVAAVLRVLDLQRTGDTSFRAASIFKPNGRVYGGQVLAQALLAAQASVDDQPVGARDVHSAGAYFLRPGRLDVPVDFEVERLHDGRSFSTRRVHALQEGVPILALTSSFQLPQPGLDASRTMAEVPGPEECESSVTLFENVDHPAAEALRFTAELDLRHVEPAVYLRPAPERAVEQHAWLRFRTALPEDLDQGMQRALLAYACDQLALEPVLRATGLHWLAPGLSLATIDHQMHFHRPLDINGWFLFQQRCISVQGGRGEASADVFDSAGRQVASFTQEGMVRVPLAEDGTSAR